MPIDRHVLSPEQAAEPRRKLEKQYQENAWLLQRLRRDIQPCAFGWDVGRNSNDLRRYEDLEQQIAQTEREQTRLALSLAEIQVREAAYTEADRARQQLPVEWETLRQEAENLRTTARTGPPALQKPEVIQAAASAWESVKRLSEAFEPLVADLGSHPYTNATAQSTAAWLGTALAQRLRPVPRPARYPWQDLVDTARGVTRETVAA